MEELSVAPFTKRAPQSTRTLLRGINDGNMINDPTQLAASERAGTDASPDKMDLILRELRRLSKLPQLVSQLQKQVADLRDQLDYEKSDRIFDPHKARPQGSQESARPPPAAMVVRVGEEISFRECVYKGCSQIARVQGYCDDHRPQRQHPVIKWTVTPAESPEMQNRVLFEPGSKARPNSNVSSKSNLELPDFFESRKQHLSPSVEQHTSTSNYLADFCNSDKPAVSPLTSSRRIQRVTTTMRGSKDLQGAARLCSFVSKKVLPSVRLALKQRRTRQGRAKQIRDLFLASAGCRPFDAAAMLQQDCTEAEFFFALSARLHHMSSDPQHANSPAQLCTSLTSLFRCARQFHSLLHIPSLVNNDINMPHALRNIVGAASGSLDCERVTLFLVNSNTQTLKVMVSKDTDFRNHINNDFKLSINEGMAGFVARTGKTVNCLDAYKDERFNPEIDKQTGFRTHSMLTAPVFGKGNGDGKRKVIAVLQAINSTRPQKQFAEREEDIINFIGLVAGQTIEHATLYEEAVTVQTQQTALLRVIDLVSAGSDVQNTITRIIESAYQLVPVERVSLCVADKAKQELVCRWDKDASLLGMRFPMASGVLGQVASSGKSVTIDNAAHDPRVDKAIDTVSGVPCRNMLVVPIFDAKHQVCAVLQCVNRTPSSTKFSTYDETLIASLAHSAGDILDKAQIHERLAFEQKKTQALLDMVSTCYEETDVEVLVGRILAIAYDIILCEKASLFFVDFNSNELYAAAGSKDATGLRLPMEQGLVGYVARTGQGLNVSNVRSDDRFDDMFDQLAGCTTVSTMVFPIHDSTGSVLAVLQVINKQGENNSVSPFGFSSQDEQIFEAITAQVGSILVRHLTAVMLDRTEVHSHQMQSLLSVYGHKPRNIPTITKSGTMTMIPTPTSPQSVNRLAPSSPVPRRASLFDWPSNPSTGSNNVHALLQLRSVDFNCWDYTPDQLLEFALLIFKDAGLAGWNVDISVFQCFLVAVRQRYRSNPYHNWYHGFMVLQFAYFCLRSTKVVSLLRDIDVLALLIGALCHDIDHPGNNNRFEVETQTHLAIKYNDISVLENHHAFTTFSLLNAPDTAFTKTGSFTKEELRGLRSMVIKGILATDMSHHFDMCKVLNSMEPSCQGLDRKNEKHRQQLADLVIHAADISAQALPLHIAVQWERAVNEEFMQQAVREEELGIPVMKFMQDLHDPKIRFNNHIGFLDFVMVPLWKGMKNLLPELSICYDNLLQNRKHYAVLAGKEVPAAQQTNSPKETNTDREPNSLNGPPTRGKPQQPRQHSM